MQGGVLLEQRSVLTVAARQQISTVGVTNLQLCVCFDRERNYVRSAGKSLMLISGYENTGLAGTLTAFSTGEHTRSRARFYSEGLTQA